MADVGDLDEVKVGGFDGCAVDGLAGQEVGGGSPVAGSSQTDKGDLFCSVLISLNQSYGTEDVGHPLREEWSVVTLSIAGRLPGVFHAPGLGDGFAIPEEFALLEEIDPTDRNPILEEGPDFRARVALFVVEARLAVGTEEDSRVALPVFRVEPDHRNLLPFGPVIVKSGHFEIGTPVVLVG